MFASRSPRPPAAAQPPDQPAAQASLPVPVPARAGRHCHPVSQAAPSLPRRPACGSRPAHPGALTEADPRSSCLLSHRPRDPRNHRDHVPSLPAQAQMAAPNSAPHADWPAPLFKIRTLKGWPDAACLGRCGRRRDWERSWLGKKLRNVKKKKR